MGSLVDRGILKKGHEGLVVATSGVAEGDLAEKDFDILNQNGIDYRFLSESYVMNGDNVNIPNEALDFVFVNLKNVIAIDRVLNWVGLLYLNWKTTNNSSFNLQQTML